jgi:hypothetical protein
MTKLKISLLKSYLAFAKASVNSKMFQKLYFRKDGKDIDILKNGDLSCAFFVSSVLKIFNLIKDTHTTVNGTVKDLEAYGWKAVKKPIEGSIIVWNSKTSKDVTIHKHIGIYIWQNKAISNSSKKRSPQINEYNYYPIEKILWNKKIK